MGKHSLPESPGFWRAVILAGLRYLVVIVLVVAVGAGVYRLVFDRDEPDSATEEELSPLPIDPLPEDPPPVTPTDGVSPTPTDPAQTTGRTQVLDGSGSQARLDAAERKLLDSGYEVASKGNAASTYERTIVVYHPGHQQMGEAVASLLGAGLVEPVGTRNLDPSIPVAVLLGPDFAG